MNYFSLPFDPTGFTQISGAQLAQLVGGLGMGASYGLCIASTDDAFGNPNVPNPTVTPAYTNFVWLRLGNASNASATLYIWNPNAATAATLLKWQIANISSITTGSITGSQIAANTITDNNIFSVSWSKLPSGAAVGGCLTGSMPNPGLANLAVVNGNIALLAINSTNITSGNNATGSMMRADGAGNVNWFVPTLLVTAPLDASIGANKFKPVIANSAGTGYTFASNGIIQMFVQTDRTSVTSASVNVGPATTANTLYTGFGAGGSISFTPQSPTSTIIIEAEFDAWVVTGTPAAVSISLIEPAVSGTVPIVWGNFSLLSAATYNVYQRPTLTVSIPSTGTVARIFKIYFSAFNTGTVGLNQYSNSTVKITELA